MQPYHFDDLKRTPELINYIEDRLIVLRDVYGWTDETEFYFLHTWLTENEYKDAILFELIQQQTRSSIEPGGENGKEQSDCDCLPNRLECFPLTTCVEGNCKKVLGCGIVNMSNCIGICK